MTSFGRLLPSGTELIPLFPYLRTGLLKGGGGNVGIRPGNRALVSDHRPTGFLTKSQARPEGIFLSFMSSPKSLVTYPPTKQ